MQVANLINSAIANAEKHKGTFTGTARITQSRRKVQNQVDTGEDQNTGFFHKIMAVKQKKETIKYYMIVQLTERWKGCSQEMLASILQVSLTNEQQSMLSQNVTEEEIRKAIFLQSSEKAPGLVGNNAHFFKITWIIVEKDVIVAITIFFQHGEMFPVFNSTAIALVPKSQSLTSILEFRPISCCLVIYKAITRILTNRMHSRDSGVSQETLDLAIAHGVLSHPPKCKKVGSLWIAWIRSYMLKGRSKWEIFIKPSYRWGVNELLKQRSVASRFLMLPTKDRLKSWGMTVDEDCVSWTWMIRKVSSSGQ
ncbi:uncharacterized protein LOC111307132 [Durio zibethinus]|uniref:Uncharacterized protein LOC111307132 n=1 Tax=Durio zibethinus TaxID=66656 RepID=A0A6P6A7I5_DURZI|nr:uncharacterized protein LOC111307132 [Durio zibethinus]